MYIVQGMHLTSEFRNVETTQSIKRKTHTMHIVVCALVKPKLQHFCHICSETHIRLIIFFFYEYYASRNDYWVLQKSEL